MGLFGVNKLNVTRLNHKDEYYKNYYFDKKICDSIEIVAAIERTSKKRAADLLMRAGLSKYMGAKLAEYIKNEQAAREQNQRIKMTHFIMVLRRYAKDHGMDISKFI
jgi:hypothetical protein